MSASSPFPHCTKCGDRIGAYEPLWLERSDGAIEATSWLRIADEVRHELGAARLFHVGCLAPDHLTAQAA